MIVAPLPIWHRMAILPYAIRRLKRQGIKPLCICSRIQDKDLCARYDADFIMVKNEPLGRKWNAGFEWARSFNPEAVIFLGPDDWVSDNYLDVMLPQLEHYEMVGIPDVYFLHRYYNAGPLPTSLKKPESVLIHWPGYRDERYTEPIGGGRLLSPKVLDYISWKPFHNDGNKNMDWNMFNAVLEVGGRVHVHREGDVKLLAISSDLWKSMSDFELMRTKSVLVEHPSVFLAEHFPEANETWNIRGNY